MQSIIMQKNDRYFMAAGRPPKHDWYSIFKDMDEWSKTDACISINAFVAQHKSDVTPRMLIEKAALYDDDNKYFSCTYELVKSRIGARRESNLSLGTLHAKAYDLNAKAYDYVMKHEHREEKTFEYELAKLQEQEKVSPEVMDAFKAFMEQMSTFGSKDSSQQDN